MYKKCCAMKISEAVNNLIREYKRMIKRDGPVTEKELKRMIILDTVIPEKYKCSKSLEYIIKEILKKDQKEITEEKISNLYWSNYTDQEISIKVGTSQNKVSRWRIEKGLIPNEKAKSGDQNNKGIHKKYSVITLEE